MVEHTLDVGQAEPEESAAGSDEDSDDDFLSAAGSLPASPFQQQEGPGSPWSSTPATLRLSHDNSPASGGEAPVSSEASPLQQAGPASPWPSALGSGRPSQDAPDSPQDPECAVPPASASATASASQAACSPRLPSSDVSLSTLPPGEQRSLSLPRPLVHLPSNLETIAGSSGTSPSTASSTGQATPGRRLFHKTVTTPNGVRGLQAAAARGGKQRRGEEIVPMDSSAPFSTLLALVGQDMGADYAEAWVPSRGRRGDVVKLDGLWLPGGSGSQHSRGRHRACRTATVEAHAHEAEYPPGRGISGAVWQSRKIQFLSLAILAKQDDTNDPHIQAAAELFASCAAVPVFHNKEHFPFMSKLDVVLVAYFAQEPRVPMSKREAYTESLQAFAENHIQFSNVRQALAAAQGPALPGKKASRLSTAAPPVAEKEASELRTPYSRDPSYGQAAPTATSSASAGAGASPALSTAASTLANLPERWNNPGFGGRRSTSGGDSRWGSFFSRFSSRQNSLASQPSFQQEAYFRAPSGRHAYGWMSWLSSHNLGKLSLYAAKMKGGKAQPPTSVPWAQAFMAAVVVAASLLVCFILGMLFREKVIVVQRTVAACEAPPAPALGAQLIVNGTTASLAADWWGGNDTLLFQSPQGANLSGQSARCFSEENASPGGTNASFVPVMTAQEAVCAQLDRFQGLESALLNSPMITLSAAILSFIFVSPASQFSQPRVIALATLVSTILALIFSLIMVLTNPPFSSNPYLLALSFVPPSVFLDVLVQTRTGYLFPPATATNCAILLTLVQLLAYESPRMELGADRFNTGNLAITIICPALVVLAVTILLGLVFNNLPPARSYPSYW